MKEKYIYNEHTLQYEKLETNYKERILKMFGLFSALIVSTFLLSPIWHQVFPNALVQKKDKEIEQLTLKLSTIQKQTDLNVSVLQAIQTRDANLYRMMFNMNPIDQNVWNGGTGGHDRSFDLAKYSSTPQIEKTQDIINRLSQQLTLQSKSLDTLAVMAKDKEKMLSSIPSIKPVRQDMLSNSLDALSGFGYRIHPIHHVRKFHKGMDFSAPSGTAIQSTGNGVVESANYNGGGYGKCVIVDHGYGYKTLYGHMSRIDVKPGQVLKKGERIGLIGSTGASTGPHCHYEVHLNGTIVNPLAFCLDGLSVAEYSSLVTAAAREGRSLD